MSDKSYKSRKISGKLNNDSTFEFQREMNKKNSYPAQQLKVVVPKTNPVTPKKPSTKKIF